VITAGELRQLLEDFHPDTPVILPSDEEGNDYNHLSVVQKGVWYEPESRIIHSDDAKEYEREAEEFGYTLEVTDAVVLWP
jgi:hypothetical protein